MRKQTPGECMIEITGCLKLINWCCKTITENITPSSCYTHQVLFCSNSFITFMHLADAFIQSDLQCIQVIHFFISMCVPWELNPQPFALLTQCSTTEPQELLEWPFALCIHLTGLISTHLLVSVMFLAVILKYYNSVV